MNYEDHLEKANRLRATRSRLKSPDDWETYTENCYNSALQIIACICIKKFNEHMDIHSGLPRFLRRKGLGELAERFDELDQLRHGRWYGNQSNGDTIKRAKEIIEALDKYLENAETK